MQTAHPAEASYDLLAPFYDRFTATSDYDAWAAAVEPLLRGKSRNPGRLLDIACGTGSSLLPFRRRGYDVAGCDVSGAMLERARRKDAAPRLHRLDMRALPLLGAHAVVTCFDDSLNYLLSGEDLEAAFRSARRNLAPGGTFAFDLNTLAAYRTTFARDAVTEDEGLTFLWRGHGGGGAGRTASATLEVLVEEADGRWRRIATEHRQRHHPAAEVRERLRRAGLDLVAARGVRSDGSLLPEPDEHDLLKTLYVARPLRGGDPE